MASSVANAIKSVCPNCTVDINTVNIGLLGESQVDIGDGKTRTYTPTPHMGELSWRISQSQNPTNNNGMFTNYTTPLGACEVYFMGVRLFSKLQSNVWPSANLLKDKCLAVYEAYMRDEDISEYETVAGLQLQGPEDMLSQDGMMSAYQTQGGRGFGGRSAG